MKIAMYFWKSKGCNDFANEITDAQIETLTKKVNGGLNGIKSRKNMTKKAYKELSK